MLRQIHTMKSLLILAIISTTWDLSHQYPDNFFGKFEGIEPSRQVIIGGEEYELGAVSLVTYDAMELCNGFGMTLVNLDDPQKNQLIREFLVAEGLGSEQFWTSGSQASGIWLWQGRGLEFNATDWAPGQPQVPQGCVYVTGNEGWGSQTCYYGGHLARYICEHFCRD